MIFVNYPGHLVAGLLLIIFAVLIVFAFRSRELQKTKLKAYRLALLLLQYVSVVILLLILWNPSRAKVSKKDSTNSVLVLFDTSESMSVVEDGRTSRLDKALDVFEKRFHPSEPDGPHYRIYGFDRKAYHSGSSDFLRRWGSQTDMLGVLALLGKYDLTEQLHPAKNVQNSNPETQDNLDRDESIKKSKVIGAVIFTDGQADDKSIQTYLPLHREDFQVVFIGVGSKDPQSDIAIKSISAPSRIAVDTAYKVQVVVTGRNLQNQPVTIELFKDDYVIDSRQLPADTFAQSRRTPSNGRLGTKDVTTEFTVGADRLGSYTLSARVKAVEHEVNLANNVRSTMVEVVEETRLKVLFYSQGASFNIGKIRQALARDNQIQLDLGLDVIKTLSLSEKALETCGYVKLPDDRDGFYKYDVIILGPCDMDSLTDRQMDGLYSFVVDRGGGLILFPGDAEFGPATWRNKKARALIPVILDLDNPAIWPPAPGEIELTLAGIDSEIIGAADLKDCDEQTSAYYRITNTKPAATTLACIKETPIISVHRVGRGRVCLLNASKVFLWYREDLQGGLLCKLMAGLTSYVGRITSVETGVELFAERVADQTNKVKFDAYVCDKAFAPVTGANVLLSIGDEVLSMDQVARGHYTAEVENIKDQSIVATAQAEGNGTFLGEKTIAVNLPPAQTEMANVELDEKFLQALSKRLKGKYFYVVDIDENVTQMFEVQTRVGSSTRMTSVWPTWPLLLVLCLLLSVSWFLRRAVGLV